MSRASLFCLLSAVVGFLTATAYHQSTLHVAAVAQEPRPRRTGPGPSSPRRQLPPGAQRPFLLKRSPPPVSALDLTTSHRKSARTFSFMKKAIVASSTSLPNQLSANCCSSKFHPKAQA